MNGPVLRTELTSILEVPVLNDKYVAKARESRADAVMLDLEDSAPPDRKLEARAKVEQVVAEADAYGRRLIFVRVNNLSTAWGRADIDALADAGPEVGICYPKVDSRAEMEQVIALARAAFPQRAVYAMIETPRSVMEIGSIASCEGLVGLHFGYIDYAGDVGCQLYTEGGDDLDTAMSYARSRVAVAAATYGLFASGGSMIPDFRDGTKVEAFVRSWKAFGYTACMALSPTHLEIIDRALRPSRAALEAARTICAVYEKATSGGALNAVLDGKVITMPDYRNATLLLARSGGR